MTTQTPELGNLDSLEKNWIISDKRQVRATITEEAFEFLEQMAFHDFGMMKKGAVGMELTKLILIAKAALEKK